MPFHVETQRMVGEMAADIVPPGSCVYDLGCSTGTTMLALDPKVTKDATFRVGVDNSESMLVSAARSSTSSASVARSSCNAST